MKEKPTFINKAELARELAVRDAQTLDRWVADGRIPPPHSQPGPRHSIWLRQHFEAFVSTGEWPKAAFPSY